MWSGPALTLWLESAPTFLWKGRLVIGHSQDCMNVAPTGTCGHSWQDSVPRWGECGDTANSGR